ncbi:MAG: putative porin [bacterium]|nr:putative porin [bacterium]
MIRTMKIIITLLIIAGVSFSFASEVDRLVEKLVEKGILTEGEAYKILAEAEEEARAQEALARKDSDKISKWIKETKFKGDIRLRYENIERDNQDGSYIADRDRTRIRFRWGFDTKVNDRLEAGLRLATGDSADPTSANQTLTEAFSDKSIWLDRAYLKYTFASVPTLSLTGGKIANPFISTNLVWSGDLNPEGIVLQKTFPIKNNEGKDIGEFFVTGGYFPVWENKDSITDPYMLGTQLGYRGKIGERSFKAAVVYYDYDDIANQEAAKVSPSCNNKGNTLYTSGGKKYYKYDYDIWGAYIDFTPVEFTLKEEKLPLTLYGEYVRNIGSSDIDGDTGFIYGFKLGNAKKQKTWEFSYDYRRLEADAVLEFMPDGSFSEGGTDAKGHTFGFKYATTDSSTLGITYMISEGLGTNKKRDVNTLQVDYAVSF